MKRIHHISIIVLTLFVFSTLITVRTAAINDGSKRADPQHFDQHLVENSTTSEVFLSQAACNFNAICEAGEHSENCSADCPRPGPVGDTYQVCPEANIETQASPHYTLNVDASAGLGYYSRFWDCIGTSEFNSGLISSDEALCSGEICDYLELSSPCPCNRDNTSRVNAAAMDLYAATQPRGRPAWSTFRSNFMLCDKVDDFDEPINLTRRFRGARIYSEDSTGNPQYQWTVLDAGLDVLLNRYSMVPILTMGYMPTELAERPDTSVPWGNCATSPPKDHDKWADFMGEIAQHILDRYGSQATDWPIEIWNEPDLPNFFWVCDPNKACCEDPYGWNDTCTVDGKTKAPTGDVDKYAQLYKYAASGIKNVDANFPVGGPVIAGDIGGILRPFLENYVGNPSAPNGFSADQFNFLSRHAYPIYIDDQLDRAVNTMMQVKRLKPDLFAQRPDTFGYYITETGPTAATGYDFQNTHFNAGWVAKYVDAFLGLTTHNVCEGGDRKGLYCESSADCPSGGNDYPCSPGRPFLPDKTCFWTKPVPEMHGLEETHFGLLVSSGDNPDNIVKRPSFNAYHALGFLSDEQIQLTGSEYGDLVHGIATRNGQDSVEVIIYNFDENDESNTSTSPAVIDLQFTNLPFESFKVSQFLIDGKCSNAYDDFHAGKSIAEQQARDDLELAMPQHSAQATNGSWSTRFRLEGNAVTLIVLEREEEPPTFEDVPFSHAYHDDIELLYQEGYTAGCSTNPLMYCPENTMSRAESAVFVERGIHGADHMPIQPTEQIFADVPLWEWFAKWSTALWEDGYTAGCGTDPLIYCPLQGHTRAEACVFYLRMMYGADYEPPEPRGYFADVDPGEWYAKWVDACWEAGIAEPCGTEPELRYCPEDALTRAVAAYMMVQAKNLDAP